jgi:hypothetical protein
MGTLILWILLNQAMVLVAVTHMTAFVFGLSELKPHDTQKGWMLCLQVLAIITSGLFVSHGLQPSALFLSAIAGHLALGTILGLQILRQKKAPPTPHPVAEVIPLTRLLPESRTRH